MKMTASVWFASVPELTCRLSIIAVTHAAVKGKKYYFSEGKALTIGLVSLKHLSFGPDKFFGQHQIRQEFAWAEMMKYYS